MKDSHRRGVKKRCQDWCHWSHCRRTKRKKKEPSLWEYFFSHIHANLVFWTSQVTWMCTWKYKLIYCLNNVAVYTDWRHKNWNGSRQPRFVGIKRYKVLFNLLMSLFPTGCFLSSNQILASSLLYKLWVKAPVVEKVKEESSKFIFGNNRALAEPDTSLSTN